MKNIDFYIRKNSIRHIIHPLILTILSIYLFVSIPFSQAFNPKTLSSQWDAESEYNNGMRYASVTLDTAYYTGYDIIKGNGDSYSYYYCINGDDCIFLLLQTEEPQEILTDFTVSAKLVKQDNNFTAMIQAFANDLGWKAGNLLEYASDIVISQKDYEPQIYILLIVLFTILFIIGAVYTLINLMYIIKPTLYPAYFSRNPKNNNKLFGKASAELSDKCLYKIENVYITENYFIDLDSHKIIILPISKIVWVYRLGTANLLPGRRRTGYSIYFLMLNGKKFIDSGKSGDCSDYIIKSLQAVNPDIIFGDTEAKRRQASQRIIDSK